MSNSFIHTSINSIYNFYIFDKNLEQKITFDFITLVRLQIYFNNKFFIYFLIILVFLSFKIRLSNLYSVITKLKSLSPIGIKLCGVFCL